MPDRHNGEIPASPTDEGGEIQGALTSPPYPETFRDVLLAELSAEKD